MTEEEVRATYGPMAELSSLLRAGGQGQSTVSPAIDTGHGGLDQALAGFEDLSNQVCASVDSGFRRVADGVEQEISNFREADAK